MGKSISPQIFKTFRVNILSIEHGPDEQGNYMKEKAVKKGSIPFKDKLAWASCDGMGTLLAWNIFASYLTYYFTDVCGLALGLAGNIILIARSCDTVTDFLIGIAIDRCHWKSGKYRGWLKIGILPMTIGLPLIFAPWENVSMTFRVIWIILIFGTYGCIWNTIVCAPTHAQLVNMTTSVEERSEIIGIREVFFNVGMFLVSAAFLPLVKAFGGGSERKGFFWAAVVFAAIGFVSMGVNFLAQKKYELNPDGTSKIIETQGEERTKKRNLLSELGLVAKNRPCIIILISVLLANTLMTIKSALMVYSFKYYFDMENFYAIAMGVFTVATILGALLIKYFVRLFRDSSRAFVCVLAMSIIFNTAFFLICRALGSAAAAKSMSFGALFFIFIISAVFQGAHYGFANLLVTNVIEYGFWLTGKLQTGLIYGIYALDISLGAAIGGKLTTVVLDAADFVPNVIQNLATKNGILFGTFIIPTIMAATQLILQLFFGLDDKKYQRCVEENEARALADQAELNE